VGPRSIEAVEKLRLREQLVALESMIAADSTSLTANPDDPGLRFVAAQDQRDSSRLRAAVGGRTPSAVWGREDDGTVDADTQRRALARDEAVHAADNVLALAEKVSAEAASADGLHPSVARVVRWTLRLHLEVADTATVHQGPTPRELALTVLRASSRERTAALRRLAQGVAERRAAVAG